MRDLSGEVIGVGRDQLDLAESDRAVIRTKLSVILERYQPDTVLNTAAYTAVDKAENEPELAEQVNGWFPGLLGEMARTIPVVHFSTDYVFDGRAVAAYKEEDPTAPLSVYGSSKRKGELALFQSHPGATVLRCSWVVGSAGQNFAKTILRLACTRQSLQVVNDQIGVPTPTTFLSAQLKQYLSGALLPGLYHLVPAGETNWYRYAVYILDRAAAHPLWHDRLRLRGADLLAISSEQYPTRARRPSSSRLDTTKWRAATGQDQLECWTLALETVLQSILDQGPVEP